MLTQCSVPDCGQPGRLLPRGRLCDDHRPAVPVPDASALTSAPRPARQYGRATTDPLGRYGAGWTVSKQTLLPVRVRVVADPEE